MKDRDKLIIRQAEAADVLAIEEVEKACFSVPWSYDSLYHDIVENKLAFYIVAEIRGRICGYVGIWKILEEGHITNVAVSPEYRRMRIASAMLSVLLEVTAEQGIQRYTLEVRKGNQPAMSLYEGFGFAEAGVRKGYYEDNGEDALIMWKEKK